MGSHRRSSILLVVVVSTDTKIELPETVTVGRPSPSELLESMSETVLP